MKRKLGKGIVMGAMLGSLCLGSVVNAASATETEYNNTGDLATEIHVGSEDLVINGTEDEKDAYNGGDWIKLVFDHAGYSTFSIAWKQGGTDLMNWDIYDEFNMFKGERTQDNYIEAGCFHAAGEVLYINVLFYGRQAGKEYQITVTEDESRKYEHSWNNSYGCAEMLNENEAIHGNISGGGDSDYYAFYVPAGYRGILYASPADVKISEGWGLYLSNLATGDTYYDIHNISTETKIEKYNEKLLTEGYYGIEMSNGCKDIYKLKYELVDDIAPIVKGVENGKSYKKSVKIAFSDAGAGIKTATLDGKAIKNKQKVTKKGKHKLVVTDNEGNTSKVSFSITK